MKFRPSEIVARVPLSLADAFVIGGFCALLYGSYLTFGQGPTLMAGGAIVVWVGSVLYRTPEKKD